MLLYLLKPIINLLYAKLKSKKDLFGLSFWECNFKMIISKQSFLNSCLFHHFLNIYFILKFKFLHLTLIHSTIIISKNVISSFSKRSSQKMLYHHFQNAHLKMVISISASRTNWVHSYLLVTQLHHFATLRLKRVYHLRPWPLPSSPHVLKNLVRS